MLTPRYSGAGLRILDFDIENRPISYAGGDFTFMDITAIAWSWMGSRPVHASILAEHKNTWEETSQGTMLYDFRCAWEQADVVTGHYIRGHDLGHINGALIEHGLPRLDAKMTVDTKNDLIGFTGYSKSQENLCALFGIPAPKVQMNQQLWRQANRLTEAGLQLTKKRVKGDVKQHKQLYAFLVAEKLLRPSKRWDPRGR